MLLRSIYTIENRGKFLFFRDHCNGTGHPAFDYINRSAVASFDEELFVAFTVKLISKMRTCEIEQLY